MTDLKFWLAIVGAFIAGQASVVVAHYVISRARENTFDHINFD